ncbi:MAG: TROVE domain-containing protein [Gammaproteobacteria bacterium]
MSYSRILQTIFSTKGGHTRQTEPMPGQVPNNAGGYYYAVDDWARLDRFLILGTEAGTYYVSPAPLTKENAEVVQRLLVSEGMRVVERIVQISASGRAPKNDTALFALALAAAAPDIETRKAALAALPKVARTGTHVLMFADFVNNMRGWGRGLRNSLGRWFLDMPVEKLSLQSVKYSQREGWSLRDLLRLAHPKTEEAERLALIDWIVHPEKPEAVSSARQTFRLVEGTYLAKEAANSTVVADIVRKYSLPREAVPTEHLNSKEVWDALLVDMPMTAMIRNLGKMSQVGLLEPMSDAADYVANRLLDVEQLKKARIHPIQLLLALRTYAQGRGTLGSLTWTPVPVIVEALNDAFDLAFKDVEPTGKRILVGVDVSSSMTGSRCAGSPVLGCVEAAIAMAMLFVRTEKKVHTMAFDTAMHEFTMTRKQRLDDVIKNMTKWGGGTDLSLPITYALKKKLEVDAFVVLTDSETCTGREHPVQTLHQYRQCINPNAKLVVLASSANRGSVVEPNDPLSFGVAGFDAAAPQLVTDFIKGDV